MQLCIIPPHLWLLSIFVLWVTYGDWVLYNVNYVCLLALPPDPIPPFFYQMDVFKIKT